MQGLCDSVGGAAEVVAARIWDQSGDQFTGYSSL